MMENQDQGKMNLSQPKDNSLDAYKAWINEICANMGIPTADDMTEEEWIQEWQEFWKG